jgi:hypothetical protein
MTLFFAVIQLSWILSEFKSLTLKYSYLQIFTFSHVSLNLNIILLLSNHPLMWNMIHISDEIFEAF